MANIEGVAKEGSKNEDFLSEEGRELLAKQQHLQESRIRAINDGDEHRRRLIEQELDEITGKLNKITPVETKR